MIIYRRSEFERSKLQNGLKFYLLSTLKCFKIYKKNKIILKWSIWWALASCGMYQVVFILFFLFISLGLQLYSISMDGNGT